MTSVDRTTYPSIMIGCMVKNAARWLPKFFSVLDRLTYPRDKLRVVFEYGRSDDNTLELLKEFAGKGTFNVEVYQEPVDYFLMKNGPFGAASIYQEFQELLREDYFLLLDSDIIEAPENLIERLLEVDEDIVAPYIGILPYGYFYDTWVFRVQNCRFHPTMYPGLRYNRPVEVDSVGTCFLARREVFRETPINNPYPDIAFCNNARKLGYRVVALPYLWVFHINPVKYKVSRVPLSPELGRYPSTRLADYTYPVISLDRELDTIPAREDASYWRRIKDAVDQGIAEMAKRTYAMDREIRRHKSLKWIYNLLYFKTYYFTPNPLLQRLQFKLAWIPEYFEVEPTTKCTMKCVMCENTYWNVPERHMSLDEFKHIVDQFPTLRWLGATGIGQHFLNKDYMDMLRYAKEKYPDIFIEIFTPFLFMNEKRSTEIIEEQLIDKIYCSIEAATKETYQKIRPGSNWDIVIRNIKRFDEIKKQFDTPKYPMLCFHYLVMKPNVHEILPFLDLIHDMDINVEFVQISRLLHPFKEIRHLYTEVPDGLRERVMERANELGIEVRWNVDTTPEDKKLPVNRCVAWTQPFIFSDGTVIPCCACNEQNDREYQIKTSLGNIFENTLEEIWYGEKFTRFRKMLYHNKIPAACKRCPIFKVK